MFYTCLRQVFVVLCLNVKDKTFFLSTPDLCGTLFVKKQYKAFKDVFLSRISTNQLLKTK